MLEKGSKGLSAILILVFMCATIMIANSITIPSDKNMPVVPKDLNDFVYSTPIGESKVPYSSGKSFEGKTEYIQVPECPITITKSIIPLSENYHPGDVVAIFVEVKNMGTKLKHITIKEYVDSRLDIISISKNAYILEELDEIANYRSQSENCYNQNMDTININGCDLLDIKMDFGDYLFNHNLSDRSRNHVTQFLNENFDINWTNITIHKSKDGKILLIRNNQDPTKTVKVTFDVKKEYAKLEFNNITYKFRVDSRNIYKLPNHFDIHIDTLERKDRIAYWYYIKLNEIGDFDASTIFRYWVEESSHFLDVDKFVTIRVVKPTLNVDVDINRLNLLKNEDSVNITYKITYMDRPINNTVKLDFVKKSSYTEIERYGPEMYIYPRDIHVGEPFTKTIKISYPNEGEYFSPEIIINGEIFPFTKEKILVETRFGKYANLVALIMAIVLFFIGDLSIKFNESSNHWYIKRFSNSVNGIRNRARNIIINTLIKILLPFVFVVPIIYFLTTISVFTLILGSLIIYVVLSIIIILYVKYVTYKIIAGNEEYKQMNLLDFK